VAASEVRVGCGSVVEVEGLGGGGENEEKREEGERKNRVEERGE
jgi:hypothetical protein